MTTLVALLFLSLAPAETPAADPLNRANMTIQSEPLGDSDAGVVIRTTFRFTIPQDVPPDTPLVIQGSVLQGGQAGERFRIERIEGFETNRLHRRVVAPPES